MVLECGEPGGVIGVNMAGGVTKFGLLSLLPPVTSDDGDERLVRREEVPPLLFALWWVGVAGGGVTVT